jgi:hypothetical protein
MNYNTLAIMTQTKPPEPLLEHELRLRAYDFYEQRGRAAGHSPRDHYVALPDNSLRERDAVTLNGRGCIRVRVEPEPLSLAGEIDSVNSKNHWHFLRGKWLFLLRCVYAAQVRFRPKRMLRQPLPVWNTLCLVF